MGAGSRGWVRGRCLGRGSTAAVYLASSTTGDPESFAVKSAELCRSAPLQREEKILSSLCSPHVVSCFGSDVSAEPDGRVLYNLFLEYVPGGSLAEGIKQNGGLDERAMRLYTRGILHGLAFLHSRGIVHCDVKGHNILVGKHDPSVVKLADFGCARWVDGGDVPAVIGGTPLYMAPEVARGEEQGPKADIWALGCTVIEMATGCPPWRDVADPVAAIHRIAFSSDVPEFPRNISAEAGDFLRRCLNRDPRERWSARELQDHPFVVASCGEELTTVPDWKGNSPKSTLDQMFWDSWADEEKAEENEASTTHGHELRPKECAQERFRQLFGGGVSPPPPPPPSTNPTREESCWITIRDGDHLAKPAGEVEPSTSGTWSAEAAGGREEPAGYITADGSAVAADADPSLGCTFTDGVGIASSSAVGNDVVETRDDLGSSREINAQSLNCSARRCAFLPASLPTGNCCFSISSPGCPSDGAIGTALGSSSQVSFVLNKKKKRKKTI